MKITNFERLFIIGTTLFLNKLFLFWLIGASHIFSMFAIFVLLILNFMILATSIDKFIDQYEQSKKRKSLTAEEIEPF